MSVRHEELRMVERSALRDDPLIGEGFHEGDDRVDLVGAQRRTSERRDDCAVESWIGATLPPRLYSSTTSRSVRTSPLWKYGAVSATLRSEGILNGPSTPKPLGTAARATAG